MECVETKGDAALLSPDFPYQFTQEGRLCHKDTLEPFVFCYRKGDALEIQRELQVLGGFISQHVYHLLETRCHLRRIPILPELLDTQRPGLLFMSPRALENPGILVVLIQDRGIVRCGQWSWRAIAREGLEKGSQLPYVQRALAEAWEVLIMNPNEGSSPEEHVILVWDYFVSRCAAQRIAVVAHGYGGVAFVDLLSRRPWQVQRRVSAVAFVDSSHSPWHQALGPSGRGWLKAHSRKWVLSSKPLNRPVGSLTIDCPQLSAGTQCHEVAPAVCMESVFRFFAKAFRVKPPPTPFDIVTRSKSRDRGKTGQEMPIVMN